MSNSQPESEIEKEEEISLLAYAYGWLTEFELARIKGFKLTFSQVLVFVLLVLVSVSWNLVRTFTAGQSGWPPWWVIAIFIAAFFFLGIDRKSYNILYRFLERTHLDPPLLRARFVPNTERPVNRWWVRYLVYITFSMLTAALLVWVKLFVPLPLGMAYTLIAEAGVLTKPPVTTLWSHYLWLTFTLLVVAEIIWVTRWFLKYTKVVRYATLVVTLTLMVFLFLWYIPVWCPWPVRLIQEYCPE